MVALVVDDVHTDARQRHLRAARLRLGDTGQRRDHDRPGLGLPPRVDDRGGIRSDDFAVPHPRFGVDGLADRTEQTDRRQIELLRDLATELHERADRGRRGVEDRDAVLLHDLPPAAGVRGIRRAFVEHLGRTVGEGAVRDVGVSGDPPDVGGAPEHVGLGVEVVHDLVREGRLGQVAAGGVQDALGLAGRSGGVQDEQRVLGGERLRLVLGGSGRDGVVPPDVAARGPAHFVLCAPHDEHMLDGCLRACSAVGEGLIYGRLQRRDATLAIAAVGGDHDLRAGVVDACAQAVCREAAEDHRVDGAQARDGEHRGDRLGDHRQVDRDPIARHDTEAREHVRDAFDLVGQLGVGHAALVARLTLPEECDAVAVACLDVPVEAVVGHVELAIREPLRERRVRPVEHLRERRVPVEGLRLSGPEALAVGVGLGVERGCGDRVRGEVGRGRESAVLGQKMVDLTAHGRAPLRRNPETGTGGFPEGCRKSSHRPWPSLPPIVGRVCDHDLSAHRPRAPGRTDAREQIYRCVHPFRA